MPAFVDEALEVLDSEGKCFRQRDDQPGNVLNNPGLVLALQVPASILEDIVVDERPMRSCVFTVKEAAAEMFT